jgi:hypothetical protein
MKINLSKVIKFKNARLKTKIIQLDLETLDVNTGYNKNYTIEYPELDLQACSLDYRECSHYKDDIGQKHYWDISPPRKYDHEENPGLIGSKAYLEHIKYGKAVEFMEFEGYTDFIENSSLCLFEKLLKPMKKKKPVIDLQKSTLTASFSKEYPIQGLSSSTINSLIKQFNGTLFLFSKVVGKNASNETFLELREDEALEKYYIYYNQRFTIIGKVKESYVSL